MALNSPVSIAKYPMRSASATWATTINRVLFGTASIDTATAYPAGTRLDDPSITIKRASAGTYTIAFPPSHQAVLLPALVSPLATVVDVVQTAESFSTGAISGITITTRNAAGTTTEPASGDVLQFVLLLRGRV